MSHAPASRGGLLKTAAVAAVGIVLILLGKALGPRGLPNGIVLLGMVIGSLNALVAVGLVLLYRAGRYINFAQGAAGAAGIVFTAKMMSLWQVPYPVAAITGLAISVGLAVVAEVAFIQRLFRAPRMIVTIATIGIAQLFAAFELSFTAIGGASYTPPLAAPLPWSFEVAPVRFGGGPILVMIVSPVVLGAIWILLKRTVWGAATEAAAENPERARLLGISVRQISTAVWAVAGLLSGVTAILQAPIVGFSFGASGGPALLLRALAPAMIGGLSGLPITIVSALALGILEQFLAFSFDSIGPINIALFLAILFGLLIQRRRQEEGLGLEDPALVKAGIVRPFPRELKGVREIRVVSNVGLLVALVIVAIVPLFLGVAPRHLATVIAIYALAAISLTMLSGLAGEISFGHWALVGFGALLGGNLVGVRHFGFLTALVLTMAAGAVVALAIGLPALRVRGLLLSATTLAFAVAAPSLLSARIFRVPDTVARPKLFGLIDLSGEGAYYLFTLAACVLAAWMVGNVRRGRWGRNFIAVRENERNAAVLGVKVIKTRLVAFAASGALAALAGYLYMFSEQKLSPSSFAPEVSLLLFSAVVIGGLGSVPGAVLGAVYLRGIQFLLPAWAQLFSSSFGLLLVLLFVPGGVGPALYKARDTYLRRVARRRNIRVPSLVADRAPGPEGHELPTSPPESSVEAS